ncbi:hypothetical protein [Virgibacillus sp. MG-45]|uniref:hypothetical protein n=1 Tax=Virgibacillus sp. MG-45 TaxID=3102791 RepID=UPI002EDA4763
MLTTTSFSELLRAQKAIENMRQAKPALYQKFVNVIQLTRQLQYKLQFLGCLIMDENPGKCTPAHQSEFVLALYQKEVEKLKMDETADDLLELLASYQKLGYATICRLALGTNPKVLVGPAVVR